MGGWHSTSSKNGKVGSCWTTSDVEASPELFSFLIFTSKFSLRSTRDNALVKSTWWAESFSESGKKFKPLVSGISNAAMSGVSSSDLAFLDYSSSIFATTLLTTGVLLNLWSIILIFAKVTMQGPYS